MGGKWVREIKKQGGRKGRRRKACSKLQRDEEQWEGIAGW